MLLNSSIQTAKPSMPMERRSMAVFFLRNGFTAEGEVNILFSTIGGNLDCQNAQLTNPEGKALNADGAKINGSVFLRDGFKANGEVNFLIATIGKGLDCSGAQLTNPNGKALNADRVNVAGYVFLRGGFKAASTSRR